MKNKAHIVAVFAIGVVSGLLGCVVGPARAWAQSVDTFIATGDISKPRFDHTATLLEDGRVLVAGGFSSIGAVPEVVEATADLFDPSSGSFVVIPHMTVPLESQQLLTCLWPKLATVAIAAFGRCLALPRRLR